ncbi:MAG: FtsX-like permease family protein [Bacteroidota bacterium]
MINYYLKTALLALGRNRGFTAINLLGLTVGMTSLLLILIWAQNEWSFDRHYPNAKKMYRVICNWEGKGEHLTVPVIPIKLRDLALAEIPEAKEFFIMLPQVYERPLLKTPNGEVFEEEELAYLSDNWLGEFGNGVVSGSITGYRANPFGLALTEERARKFFGDADPLDQTVELFGLNYTVELVLKDTPPNSSFQQKVFLPLQSYWPNRIPYERELKSSNYKFVAFFKASETMDLKKVETKFTNLMGQVDPKKPTSCSVFPLEDMRFEERFTHDDLFEHQNKATVHIFALIALVILLAAILNYINLSTAAMNKRIHEIGIRRVIGANSRNIFFQVITESVIISMASFLLSLIAVYCFMPFLARYTGVALQLDLTQRAIWILLTSVLILTTGVASLYPALLHAGLKPIQLVGKEGTSFKGGKLRKILVIGQFTASIVVLSGAIAIYQQLEFIKGADVGYDRDQILSLKLKYKSGDNYGRNLDNFQLLKEELGQIQGIRSLAIADRDITKVDNRNSGSLDWEGKPEDQSVIVSQLRANADLVSVFDLKMEQGRWFLPGNLGDKNNIIVNETAIKTLGIPEPVVGRWSSFQDREGQIVGVVKDFHFDDFHQSIEPLVIWHNGGRGPILLAKLQAGQRAAALLQIQQKFERFFPDKPFEYSFLDDTFLEMHQADMKAGALLQIFTGILIFISCLGLLALTVHDVQRRQREMAIRKVLGASMVKVVQELARNYMTYIGIAFVLAVPIAFYFLKKWLENFAYHMEISFWLFLVPGLIVFSIAMLTMGGHSVKAALMPPVKTLRN